jgi:hypothetical protein
MTQEQKNLLMKDLCGRLPYGVKISVEARVETLESIDMYDYVVGYSSWLSSGIEDVKPYLLPLSSMTEEQKEEHKDLLDNQYLVLDANGNVFTLQDFYCKYHLDYRGFIPNGLAEDATGKNIY